MTTYEKGAADAAQEDKKKTKEETKAVIVVPPPESRIKSNPSLWSEASILADMLRYCRPNNSKSERGFIGKYFIPIGVTFDKKGNAHKIIGDAPVIWSSHTDTVHSKNGIQKVVYWVDDKSGDTFFGAEGPNASCLGADDTAGVWIMLQMIKAEIPGHYIFHRGEECGGIGSRWIARECAELLKHYKFAIAFDRKDTESIITYQGSKMTASDEFAKLLAEQIGMGHKPDHTGMWTDTAAYVDEIAECTNISVGYYNAHCRDEKLNIDYLFKLRDAMCKIDVTKFAATRKPGENTYKYHGDTRHWDGYDDGYHGHWNGNNWNGKSWHDESKRPKGGFTSRELDSIYGFNSWMSWFGYDSLSGFWLPLAGTTPPNPEKPRKRKNKNYKASGWVKRQQELFSTQTELKEMRLLIEDNPTIIADLLDGQGYGPFELREYITKCSGIIYDDVKNTY